MSNFLVFNKSSLFEAASTFFFGLLMFGYIAYHLFVAYGFISPFLGGYFGIMAIATFCFFLLAAPDQIIKNLKYFPVFSLFHFFIFLLAALITLLDYMSITSNQDAILQSSEMLVFWYAFYCLGFYFCTAEKGRIYKISVWMLLFFFAYLIYYISITGNVMLYLNNAADNVDSDAEIAGYQGIARNLLIVSLFVISYTSKKIYALLFSLIMCFALFVVGARSEFYAFILALIAYQFILSLKYKSSFIALILFFLFGFAIFSYFSEQIMSSRQFQVFDLSQSASWSARQNMEEFAIHQIKSSPIFGLFGGHTQYGSTGTYAHNALSAYVNYGLFFFLIYTGITIYSVYHSFFEYLKNLNNKIWLYSLLMSLCTLFLIVTAKPVFWPVVFFSWGLFASAYISVKRTAQQGEAVPF